MRLFESRRSVHCASLVAAALLLCLGAFLSWIATEPEVPATLKMADSPHMEQETNGYPLAGSYLAVPAEEVKDSDRDPVNAGLLTALLLTFFGTTVGWLLSYDWRQGVFRPSDITRRPSFVSAREDTPFLGVFRL